MFAHSSSTDETPAVRAFAAGVDSAADKASASFLGDRSTTHRATARRTASHLTSDPVSPASTEADRPALLECRVVPERDRVRVVLVGELDMATAPTLEQTVNELRLSGFNHLVMDLSRLQFLDVVGLRVVLALDASARDDGDMLELIAGPEPVQRIFALTGTLGQLRFRFSTLEHRVRDYRRRLL